MVLFIMALTCSVVLFLLRVAGPRLPTPARTLQKIERAVQHLGAPIRNFAVLYNRGEQQLRTCTNKCCFLSLFSLLFVQLPVVASELGTPFFVVLCGLSVELNSG